MQKELVTSVIAPTGARWIPETVKRDSGDVEIPSLILVFDLGTPSENVENALLHFGADTMSHFINGTSFRVIQQGMWRHAKMYDVDKICGNIVGFRSGRRSAAVHNVVTVTVVKLAGPNGTIFDTVEEQIAAWQEFFEMSK